MTKPKPSGPPQYRQPVIFAEPSGCEASADQKHDAYLFHERVYCRSCGIELPLRVQTPSTPALREGNGR
jgi:hypothetical protein